MQMGFQVNINVILYYCLSFSPPLPQPPIQKKKEKKRDSFDRPDKTVNVLSVISIGVFEFY